MPLSLLQSLARLSAVASETPCNRALLTPLCILPGVWAQLEQSIEDFWQVWETPQGEQAPVSVEVLIGVIGVIEAILSQVLDQLAVETAQVEPLRQGWYNSTCLMLMQISILAPLTTAR